VAAGGLALFSRPLQRQAVVLLLPLYCSADAPAAVRAARLLTQKKPVSQGYGRTGITTATLC
jgi:hypothetical protein